MLRTMKYILKEFMDNFYGIMASVLFIGTAIAYIRHDTQPSNILVLIILICYIKHIAENHA